MISPDYYTDVLTLDWDRITLSEAMKRMNKIIERKDIDFAELWKSSTKGYHLYIKFLEPVQLLPLRWAWKDDGIRLIKDQDRSHKAHDILWKVKRISGMNHYAQKVITYVHV